MAINMTNITAKISVEPDIRAKMTNATYGGNFASLTEEEKASLKGEKGDKGDPGVYIGENAPQDEDTRIWIDLSKETFDYKAYVDGKVSALTNVEIENLLGGNI